MARSGVVVVGAGPVGCLLAALLAERGWGVTAYEKRPDLRAGRAEAGRSINLVLTRRGLAGLSLLGLRDPVLDLTVPVLGRMMHDHAGALTYTPYGKDDSECNYSVSRGQLNEFLLDAAEQRGVTVHFEHELTGADLDQGVLTFATPGGEVLTDANLVFGCDGAPSAVREAVMGATSGTASMDMISHGYKELVFPAGDGGAPAMAGHALHIWPRGHHMLMGLANLDGSFTGTIYLPMRGEDSFELLQTESDVTAFFAEHYPDAPSLLAGDYAVELCGNPVGHLGTVRSAPWSYRDRALLVGDAAHAIVPFFGQGLNCGFEDCRVLDGLLERGDDDLEGMFTTFFDARKANADAIADMALENFVEMRDLVGDPGFILRKRVEARLEAAMPEAYRTRYAMVMYSPIPYDDARRAGLLQTKILDQLTADIDDPEEVDLDAARRLIDEWLTPWLRERNVDLSFTT